MHQVDYPTVSVNEAAAVLRVSPRTLYRNMESIPHEVIGGAYRIHVAYLGWFYVPSEAVIKYDSTNDPAQLEFVYDVPVRSILRYRTGQAKRIGDYEVALSHGRTWRNPRLFDPKKH